MKSVRKVISIGVAFVSSYFLYKLLYLKESLSSIDTGILLFGHCWFLFQAIFYKYNKS